MNRRKDRSVYAVLIIMGIITVISLTFTGIIGALYIRQSSELKEMKRERDSLESNVFEAGELEEETVPVIASGDNLTQDEVNKLLEEQEISVESQMKSKMKELITSKDGGPMTMLRYFFPENLVFYDDKTYAFEPIIDSVKKHNLIIDNFKKNDLGEMEYIVNGEVTSHKGIDVSKYQGDIDWQAVKNDGVEYAFVRLGLRGYESGKIVLDDHYDQNMRGANDSGVLAGVYFFTQAISKEEALEEAQFVIDNLKDYDVPYPVVLDVEAIAGAKGRANNLTKEERTDICIAFCEAVKSAGYTPMIYGNIKCFTRMLDITRLEQYDKWYAFYDDYMYFPYDVSMWQYTEKGSVNGIEGKVDMNIAYKTW